MSKFSNDLIRIFHWLFLIFALFLFASSVFVTATHEKYEDGSVQEFAKVTSNNMPITLLQFALGLLFVYFVFGIIRRLPMALGKLNTRLLAVVVSILSFSIAFSWIKYTNIIPGADQEFCVKYAIAMNNGDFSSLERCGYLATYPQQIGLVTFLRLLFIVFGEGNYSVYRYFSAVCISLLVYSGYRVTSKLSKGNCLAEIFYLISMLFCVPMYGYVLYIYGEIAGSAFCMLSIWMYLETLESRKLRYLLLLFLSLVLAMVFRKNMAIIAIAIAIVAFVRFLKGKKIANVAIIILAGCAIFVSAKAIPMFCSAGMLPTNSELPSAAWIAMGFNYDNGFAGWYNYYAPSLHVDNEFYTDATAAAAKEVIKTVYIPYFVHNPKIAIDFFFNKINSQWQSPLYQSIVSNNLLYGGQNAFVMSVYFGFVGAFLEWFMKIYQMLMYLSIVILLWVKRKECVDISFYVTMIASFGAFLLSVIWEAKGRYILPSFLILIPVYALGAKELYQVLDNCFKRLICQLKKSFHDTK